MKKVAKKGLNRIGEAKTRRISPKRARAKGLQFERDVANLFKGIGKDRAERRLEFQNSKCIGVDLDNTGPFAVQCKNFFKYVNPSLIEEIQDETRMPVLVTKAHGKTVLAVIHFETFLKMVGPYMRENPHPDWIDPKKTKVIRKPYEKNGKVYNVDDADDYDPEMGF